MFAVFKWLFLTVFAAFTWLLAGYAVEYFRPNYHVSERRK